MKFNRLPKYPKTPHKYGQARIKIKGKEIYLGAFGSDESKAKFHRVIAEYLATGNVPQAKKKQATVSGVTVLMLINEFRKFAIERYRKDGRVTAETNAFHHALKFVEQAYSGYQVDAFGPKCLLAVRAAMVQSGLCGREVNKRLGRIRRVFKWGVSRELVRFDTWAALRTVEGVRKGQVRNPPPISPVNTDRVNAIQELVSPVVWTMIQMQLLTAMRPGEVCIMRTCDVYKDGKDAASPLNLENCWLYIPASHKTEHHGRSRVVILGPQAQQVLEPWLQPDHPTRYIFSPRDTARLLGIKRSADAAWAGKNQQRVEKPQRRPGEKYGVQAYGRAIARACELAFGMPKHLRKIPKQLYCPDGTPLEAKANAVARERLLAEAVAWREANCWAPNQLRHTAATEIRRKHSVEIARIILGHVQIATTEIYAERDYEAAARAVAQFG